MKWASKQTGFTIVELLIVVVVIAILAAITIVSYNGISARATEAVVRSDLRNIGNQMELFYAKNDRYPDTTSGPFDEIAQVLRDANLYQKTRSPGNEVIPGTTFVFCGFSDRSQYLVVALAPLISHASSNNVGKKIMGISSKNGMQEAPFTIDSSITGGATGGKNACKSIDSSYQLDNVEIIWSYSAPTVWAQ